MDRKNMVRIELTEKGYSTYTRSARRDSIHGIMSVLSEKERKELGSYLIRLRDKALEMVGKEYRTPFPPL